MYKRTKQPYSTPKVTTLTVKENALLMDFLLAKMGGMSRNAVKSLLKYGQVAVNGKAISQFDHPLQQGDNVQVSNRRTIVEKDTPQLHILYEDDHIIVIDKAAGLLTVTTGSGMDTTAFSILKEHVLRSSPKNKIFTVHRLDQLTSGVLVFAKTGDVQHAFRDNWRDVVTKRTYIALVEGKVEKEEGKISSWLTENKKTHVIYSSNTDNGGKPAVTRYKRLQFTEQFSLLEVELETGRKNQIRVHMKDIGHPIVGDRKYGSQTLIGRIALHARVLEFYHPVTGERMNFETSVPKEFMKFLK
ncbi:MAG: RluA family pseudouridine synthase [Petrimonas sp.]|nr:RluA family pseudouridine synthase [Petrimonas sp.]